VLYDILGAKGGEACLQVTEDRRNAIVLGQGGFNEITCVVEAGTLAVSQQDWSRQDVEEAGDLFFVRGVPLDDQFTTTIQYALDNNLLQGKKVGVWYGGLFPNQNDTFEKVGLPLLETSGVEFKAFRTDFTGPSDPQGSTVLKTAAAEFASMGIDVLLNFTGATNHPGMKNELNALGVKPQYISAPVSGNSSIELFAKSFNTAEISNGEIYTTYAMPVGQVDASMPGAASCMEQYTAATGETVEPATFDYSVIINVCTQIDMVAAILSLAGPELTQAGMVAAIEALPAYANARSLGEVYYGPGGRFDIHAMGILQYDGTTNKTSFDGELLPIDE
jgi:hypothetical protein